MPAVHPRRRRRQFADAQPKTVFPLVDVTGLEPADPPHEEQYTKVYGSGFGESETGQAKAEVFYDATQEWGTVTAISYVPSAVGTAQL